MLGFTESPYGHSTTTDIDELLFVVVDCSPYACLRGLPIFLGQKLYDVRYGSRTLQQHGDVLPERQLWAEGFDLGGFGRCDRKGHKPIIHAAVEVNTESPLGIKLCAVRFMVRK